MKIVLTLHAKEKLQTQEARLLGITLRKITNVINKPLVINKNLNPHQSIGELTENLSLAVIWKTEGDIIKVITFYPAEKGRYESKVLRRR